jgi:transposase
VSSPQSCSQWRRVASVARSTRASAAPRSARSSAVSQPRASRSRCPCPITGRVDTHLDAHVAAVVDVNGGVLAVESFPTTTAGFAELHERLVGFGEMERVGVEGTGAYGAGLARHVRGCGSK